MMSIVRLMVIVAVSYKGTPAALLDVMSGQVHLMLTGRPSAYALRQRAGSEGRSDN